jgi:hypothetical protein
MLILTLCSGFDLYITTRNYSDPDNFTASCTRALNRGETITGTLSHGKGPQALFTAGIQAHQAWAISWAESDTATMSPSPPNLSDFRFALTWVPGKPIDPQMYKGASDTSGVGGAPLIYFGMIGGPIIGVTIIALCIWCCCCQCRGCRGDRGDWEPRVVSAQPQETDTTAPPPYSK